MKLSNSLRLRCTGTTFASRLWCDNLARSVLEDAPMTTTFYILMLTLITQVSAPERNSAAATKPATDQNERAAAAQGPALTGPLIEKAMNGLSSLGDAFGNVQKPNAASEVKHGQG